MVFYVFIWHFLPGLLALVFSYQALSSLLYYDVSEIEFTLLYVFESAALCLILFILLRLAKNFNTTEDFKQGWHQIKKSLVFLILFLCSIYLVYIASFGNYNYLEKNSAAFYGAGGGMIIINFIGGIFLSSLVVLTLMAPKRTFILYFSFFLTCAFAGISVLAGSRIAFVGPIVVLIFRYFNRFEFSARNYVLSFFVLLFTFYVILPMSHFIGQARGVGDLDVSLLARSGFDEGQGNKAARMIFVKFDAFSGGISLIKRGGGLGSAGIKPYYGSALVFIPRFIWQSRPVAGSSDGSIYGHPTRIVPSLQGADSDSYNVGVSSLAISLWQLSFLGFPVFVFSGVGFLLFINRLLQSCFLNRVLGVYLLSIPSFHMLVPSPDVILKQIALVAPILALYGFHRRFRRKLLGGGRL